MKFRITAQHRGFWLASEQALTLAGRYEGPIPCVGDWVETRESQIVALHPRATFFARRAAGTRKEQQAIAANVDVAFLVMGLDGDFNLRRLERYLVLVRESGAWPVVLLTKADLCEDVSSRLAAVRSVATGADVHAISAPRNEGLDRVQTYLQPGITGVLMGSSGAGKSTLLNALLGEQRMATAEVRLADSRGRHTTTHRELMELPGGACIIDTPGMRELQLWVDEESVAAAFPDIEELAWYCRFTDCRHQSEPGCAVREALERGEIEEARIASLHKLRREAEHIAAESDPLVRRARNAKWKSINKSMKYHPKYLR